LMAVDRRKVERAWVRTFGQWLTGRIKGLFIDRPGHPIELQKDN